MKRSHLGFSLVELLIAIGLGVLLMTGVVQMFLGSKQTFSTQQGVSKVQETGRLAIEFISRDLREAGYYGCYSPINKIITVVPSNLNLGGLQKNFDFGITAYESAASPSLSVADDLGATIVPVANTEILVVKNASSQIFVGNTPNTANAIYAFSALPLADSCVGEICNGSAVVVSDCSKARVFQVSATPSVATNTLTLQHTQNWGGADKKPENFDQLSEVSALHTTVYFLATGAGGGPSLFQRIDGRPATELVEDVENVHYTFRLNDTTYKTISQMNADMNNWKLVSGVRVEMLVRSTLDNVVDRPQSYTFAGTTVAQASVPDRRIRKVFSTTVGIRNR